MAKTELHSVLRIGTTWPQSHRVTPASIRLHKMDARPFPNRPEGEAAPPACPNPALDARPRPRPPMTHAAAAALPRRHLGCCHVSRGAKWNPAGSGVPGLPKAPDPKASAFWGHPGRGHASRALVKPLPPPRSRPAAGRAQASRNPSPTRGRTARAAQAQYLRHGLSRWGVPLQSLVLLPLLQKPMLPQALLPLIRHGGRGPCGSGGKKARTRTEKPHLSRRRKDGGETPSAGPL